MTATVDGILRAAIARLRAAGVPGPARDARLLMARALGLAPERLALAGPDAIPPGAAEAFAAMVAARARLQPVAQILGRREFWGRAFAVTADVLDPRPETETLIARALDGPAPATILDLGTGSGAILVTLLAEWPGARGTGTDASAAALGVARGNAERHGVAERAAFLRADWGDGVAGRFELVVANPPYIPAPDLALLARDVRDWEPHLALSPGPTGLEAYRRIAGDLDRLLAPGGRALFEIGESQGDAVAAIFRGAGFKVTAIHPDLDGRDRVLGVSLPR